MDEILYPSGKNGKHIHISRLTDNNLQNHQETLKVTIHFVTLGAQSFSKETKTASHVKLFSYMQ